jgi:AcrR family transcriptional regulator
MNSSASDRPRAELPARQRILLTAHDLFYRDGIRATGIDRVIAESGVAKKTFYRHFPSKNDLVEAFLDYRHQRWIAWFRDALRRHGGGVAALVPALREWFEDPLFRGCAFINSVGELGPVAPRVAEFTLAHKQDLIAEIVDVMPDSTDRQIAAEALALAVDGAIVRVQYEQAVEGAIAALQWLVERLGSVQDETR